MRKKNILMVNWSWFPSGGDWTYVENLKNLYTSKGYEVIPFSTNHERNIESEYSRYFVEQVQYKSLNKNQNFGNSIKAVKNSIISNEALTKLDSLLNDFDFEFAHFHNIHHHLTPAIIWKLKKKNIKILWTLHDYKIICPENSFVSNGQICEKCLGGKFIHCALNKCKLSSRSASILTSFEAYFYKFLSIYDKVDAFLCPSKFLYNKFSQAGFSVEKLSVSNYCYDTSLIDSFMKNNEKTTTGKPYILYIGRIEKIKGIRTLIEAVMGTDVYLKVAGQGTDLKSLSSFVEENKISNVEFLGFCDKNTVYGLTNNAEFVVCPSEWYENFPFSVIESLLFSKPVIGANIGGIPELVVDNITGLLFEAGNSISLRKCILDLWDNPMRVKDLGLQARKHVQMKIDLDKHWTYLNNLIHSKEN